MSETLTLVVLASGVIASFTAFGYAQEAVTKTSFEGERFVFTSFLVLLQSVGNATVAASVLVSQRKSLTAGVPPSEWVIVAAAYFGAHKCGLKALSYISFPMQVVCKSCKAIPVMFGEKLFAKKRHSVSKMCGVFCMCLGVVMFTLLGPKKRGADASALETGLGLALVLGALVCDGIYGPYQNKIKDAHDVSAWHLMFNMNLYQGVLALLVCLAYGELAAALDFCARKGMPIVKVLAVFCVAMAMGNIFIYQLQAAFGALTVTTVTTMRKLVSVLFSVFFFGHSLSNAQWLAVLIVIFYKQEGDLLAAPFSGAAAAAAKKQPATQNTAAKKSD